MMNYLLFEILKRKYITETEGNSVKTKSNSVWSLIGEAVKIGH